MFTPPPSPQPPPIRPPPLPVPDQHAPATIPSSQKYTVARRMRWSVVLVPLTLVLLVIVTRFLPHPVAFDLLIPDTQKAGVAWTEIIWDWSPHTGHSPPSDAPLRRSPTPTVAPPVPHNPVLPTPFPQPFDTTLSTNFSTNQCYNFFLNMTQTTPFRACRPFSLLLTHSHEFQEAQNNITAMNIDVWGTCNTALSWDQCSENMAWFASDLLSSCVTDLGDQNAMAVGTLMALEAFDLMRNVSCQVNPTTDAYCYVESVANSDPSSYWFYLLPLDQPLVPITADACNQCTKALMTMYADASTSLSGLQQTYANAAKSLNAACGANYAKASTTSAAPMRLRLPPELLFACVLFASWYFSVM